MTVTTTNQDPAPTRRSPAAPATAADRTHPPHWTPPVALLPRDVHAPVRRSFGAAMRPVLPYFVAYVVIGIALARWGGTDSSESNVSFAWEWFTMPLVVAFSYIVVVPFLALEWVQRRVRRNRRQPERATAPVLAPAAFRAKAKLWPQRRRWSAPEGTLVLNDECIAFESPGRHHRRAVAVPWSSVTELRLHRSIAWGKAQRGHLTIGVTGTRPVELMVPRSGYDRLAELLATPAAATEEAAPVGWVPLGWDAPEVH